MTDIQTPLVYLLFVLVVFLAASCIFLFGAVSLSDMKTIFGVVGGASITMLSAIVMSIVLESVGFFRWSAFNLIAKARGSGILLFWYINLLCFLMTLFFNIEASILITTPIMIQTFALLQLKPHEKIPYLISGALVAAAASAPIGASSLSNLIGLKMAGLDMNTYATMMFIPSMAGIGCITALLFSCFREAIPVRIHTGPASMNGRIESFPDFQIKKLPHPLASKSEKQPPVDGNMFRICIAIVVLTRISFFALAPLGIAAEWPAAAGAILLIVIRWHKKGVGALDVVRKSPWHIFILAFGMYVIIYGLHNAGMTTFIIQIFGDTIAQDSLYAILIAGLLLTVLSNICNHLPSFMIGTLAIGDMGLNLHTFQAAYLACVIGADIGSLMLPIGTSASFIWLHILKKHHISIDWIKYVKVTFYVIPAGLIVSLLMLYLWTLFFFYV